MVGKGFSGPPRRPNCLSTLPSLPAISNRDNYRLLGSPQARGRERGPGNQKPGSGPSCATPESWGGWLRDQAPGASGDNWDREGQLKFHPCLLCDLGSDRPGSRMMPGPGPCGVIPFITKPPSFPCSAGTALAQTVGPVA